MRCAIESGQDEVFITSIIKDEAQGLNMSLDRVVWTEDGMNFQLVLMKRLISGETAKLRGEWTMQQLSAYDEDYWPMALRDYVRNLYNTICEHITIAEHKLVFYIEDGFFVEDLATGFSIEVVDNDRRGLTTGTPVELPEQASLPLPQRHTYPGTLSQETKQELQEYVIGWAATNSINEVMGLAR